jgi:hypothetical protein
MKREREELRQQLQLLNKKVVTALDQARKSSDREQAALFQAPEARNLEKATTLRDTCSAERESYMLDFMTDASQDMTGEPLLPNFIANDFLLLDTDYNAFSLDLGFFLDIAAEEQRVNLRVGGLMRLAAKANIDFWADEEWCRRIVQFHDRAAQTRTFTDFCRSSLGMVYNAIFSRNPQPENLDQLMEKFKNVCNIHEFVNAQMVVGAKFALIWPWIRHPKIDLNEVTEGVLLKTSKREIKLYPHIEAVSGAADKMIDKLLEIDSGFFKEFRYDDLM